jgi:hypothetical protein
VSQYVSVRVECYLTGPFPMYFPADRCLDSAYRLILELAREDPVMRLDIMAGETRWSWRRPDEPSLNGT